MTTRALPAGCGDTSWRRLPLRSVRRSGCPLRTCHAERRWRASLMPSILESAEHWHASLSRDGVSAESGDSAGHLQYLIEIDLVTEVGVPLAAGARRACVLALQFPVPLPQPPAARCRPHSVACRPGCTRFGEEVGR